MASAATEEGAAEEAESLTSVSKTDRKALPALLGDGEGPRAVALR